MKYPPMVPKTSYCRQDSSYTRQIQCFGRYVIDYRQIVKTEWELDKLISNSISRCSTIPIWICLRYVSVTIFQLCVPSSGQSSLCDRRIFHELEQYSCLCISYNNTNSFCPEQDTPISVQNESYSSSLTITNMVLRGSTTICLGSSSSSTLSKLLTQAKESFNIKISQYSTVTPGSYQEIR